MDSLEYSRFVNSAKNKGSAQSLQQINDSFKSPIPQESFASMSQVESNIKDAKSVDSNLVVLDPVYTNKNLLTKTGEKLKSEQQCTVVLPNGKKLKLEMDPCGENALPVLRKQSLSILENQDEAIFIAGNTLKSNLVNNSLYQIPDNSVGVRRPSIANLTDNGLLEPLAPLNENISLSGKIDNLGSVDFGDTDTFTDLGNLSFAEEMELKKQLEAALAASGNFDASGNLNGDLEAALGLNAGLNAGLNLGMALGAMAKLGLGLGFNIDPQLGLGLDFNPDINIPKFDPKLDIDMPDFNKTSANPTPKDEYKELWHFDDKDIKSTAAEPTTGLLDSLLNSVGNMFSKAVESVKDAFLTF